MLIINRLGHCRGLNMSCHLMCALVCYRIIKRIESLVAIIAVKCHDEPYHFSALRRSLGRICLVASSSLIQSRTFAYLFKRFEFDILKERY